MSTNDVRQPLTWSTAMQDSAKLLPYLALFVRVGLGLGLLNGGLAGVMSGRPNAFGGSPSRGMGPLGGIEGLIELFPYVELALGLGLTFGVFTTIMALVACAVALMIPAFTTVMILGSLVTGYGGMGFGYGYGSGGAAALQLSLFTVGLALAAIPGLVVVVVLSPLSINRFSVDALIFRRTPPIPPIEPVEYARPEIKPEP